MVGEVVWGCVSLFDGEVRLSGELVAYGGRLQSLELVWSEYVRTRASGLDGRGWTRDVAILGRRVSSIRDWWLCGIRQVGLSCRSSRKTVSHRKLSNEKGLRRRRNVRRRGMMT